MLGRLWLECNQVCATLCGNIQMSHHSLAFFNARCFRKPCTKFKVLIALNMNFAADFIHKKRGIFCVLRTNEVLFVKCAKKQKKKPIT